MSEKGPAFIEGFLEPESGSRSGPPRPETPPMGEGEKKTFSEIVFEKETRPDGSTGYKSSDPLRERKLIRLDRMSPVEPKEGAPYEVEVIKDTKLLEPLKGTYFVRIREEGSPESEVPLVEKRREERGEIFLPIMEEKQRGKLLVLETELPLNPEGGPLVPPPENFRHFTLDRRTLEVLEKGATAVELREPALLEGETSTSKTSSLEYLAMLSGHEVVRMNLNGQTDTSELIGKFVPNDGQLQITFEELLRDSEKLAESSRAIVERANKEGRGLALLESQKIAKSEGLEIPEWRWQDGIVPQAMKEGKWVVLDEINLAEPQILERLNSVLEKNPSLTLSENGGIKIGPGGEFTVNPNFRIFATMNPSESVGRAPMSPAFKDRWTSYKYVEAPSEEDYLAMLNFMVYGEQPRVEIRGRVYQGASAESLFPTLAQIPNFRGFSAKLAKFQTTVEGLAKRREIGKNRKEQYTFTRRGLIEFLGYLEEKTIVDRRTGGRVSVLEQPKEVITRAIRHVYLDKISNPEDLKKVEDHLGAIGISEKHWTHEFGKVPKPEAGKPGERKEGEGRDPAEFFREVFAKGRLAYDVEYIKENWDWCLSEEGWVAMGADTLGIPDSLIDKEVAEEGLYKRLYYRRKEGEEFIPEFYPTSPDEGHYEEGKGIDNLIKRLAGKKILSVRGKGTGEWFLQVVEAEGPKT